MHLVKAQDGLARRAGEAVGQGLAEVATDHLSNSGRKIERPALLKNLSPITQYDDTVSQSPDVAHAMRYVEDRDALGAQSINHFEKAVGLGRAKARGRLVEDQHRGLCGGCPRNGDELTLRRPKRSVILVKRKIQANMRGDFRRSSLDLPRPSEGREGAAAELIQNQILRDADARHAQLIRRLMNGDDAALSSAPGRRKANWPPVEQYSSLIGLDNAGGDFRERRFARAIRAQKRNDFAPSKNKIDILERLGRTKALGHGEER